MNEVAFEELLMDAQSSTAIVGLRKLILTAALRGEFDVPSERHSQLRNALQRIKCPAVVQKVDRGRARKREAEIGHADSMAVHSADDPFVVNLGEIATIEKGKTGIKDAQPGEYPMVVTAESRLSADHFDFEGPAVIIPLVSSTGHGDASLNRIHYQDGRYAVGSILCVVQSRYPNLVHPRYLYEYLAAFKEELLVSRMSGTANVSLNVGRIQEVPVPLITYVAQKKLEQLMSLCDVLESNSQLEATQHAQLVSTLLATLTDSETPERLAANWQRIATHFDLLLDRPEAVDALEQTILQLAVRGLLVPQDPKDEPASELLKKIHAEKEKLIAEGKSKRDKPQPPLVEEKQPFQLPDGWEWATMDSLASQITDGAHHTPTYIAEGVPFLSVKDLSSGFIDFSDTRFISPQSHEDLAKRCNPEMGDVLLTKIGTTGIAVVVDTSRAFSLFVSVALIKLPSVSVHRDFLSLVINSPFVRQQSEDGTEGVGNKNLVLRKIKAFQIPIPPLAEQSRIVTRVAQLRRLCADLRQRLSAIQSTHAHLAETLIAEIA